MLRKIIKTMLPGLDNAVRFGLTYGKIKPPSIMSLGKATAFEILEFWEMKAASGAGKADLKKEIGAGFTLILLDLLDCARTELKLNSSNMIRRLRLFALSAIFPLIEQMENFAETYQSHGAGAGGGDGGTEPDFMRAFQHQEKENIVRYESLATQLDELNQQCSLLPAE